MSNTDALMESRAESMEELASIERQLGASDEPTSDLIDALLQASRALKLPIHGRADTHLFVEGDQSVESATWTQCGALVSAIATL